MAEGMTDFVLLEAAEDREILVDISDDVTGGSNVEDIMFEVPLSEEDAVFSSKQSGERSSSNTAPTCSLRISWMPLSRGRL